MEISMNVIAKVHSDFPSKFGIPRQAGLVPELRAFLVFEPAFRNPDMLRGLDGFVLRSTGRNPMGHTPGAHVGVIWRRSDGWDACV